jgi:hypothetical protein
VPDAELFRPEADVAILDAMADYESWLCENGARSMILA